VLLLIVDSGADSLPADELGHFSQFTPQDQFMLIINICKLGHAVPTLDK